MNRNRILVTIPSILLVCLLLTVGVAVYNEPRVVVAQSTLELPLVNPGFEGEYVTVPGGYVAQGWTSYYKEGTRPPLADTGGGSNITRRPEFKPILAAQYPNRVAEGEKAQVLFAFYGIMDSALSTQAQIPQHQLGKDVQFSIQGEGWSTNSDDPNQHSGEVYISLGIGAEGQAWPWEHGIVWTRYEWTPAQYKTFYSRPVKVNATTVTLFILVTNKWAVKHNDVYLDDVHAWVILDGGAGPTPTPYPTYTAYPTLTPWPTFTPFPTWTPSPVTPCPTCEPGTGGCDYDIIRGIVETVVANREPAYYPR